MTTTQDQHYDIKCDSPVEYRTALGDAGARHCPRLKAGTRVLREDGNVYIVTGDMVCLKSLDGIYVTPLTLEVLPDQDEAALVAEMILE